MAIILMSCCRRPVSAGAVPLGLGLSMSMNKRGTVPVRDETGRFTGVRPKTAAERLQVGMQSCQSWLYLTSPPSLSPLKPA